MPGDTTGTISFLGLAGRYRYAKRAIRKMGYRLPAAFKPNAI